jgi:hypothetical protein
VQASSDPTELFQAAIRAFGAGAELFEDAAVVREHEEYFCQAIATTSEG